MYTFLLGNTSVLGEARDQPFILPGIGFRCEDVILSTLAKSNGVTRNGESDENNSIAAVEMRALDDPTMEHGNWSVIDPSQGASFRPSVVLSDCRLSWCAFDLRDTLPDRRDVQHLPKAGKGAFAITAHGAGSSGRNQYPSGGTLADGEPQIA